MSLQLVVKPAIQFSGTERDAFAKLVTQDTQVAEDGLSDRIAQAHLLAFLFLDDKLVGINAVKNNLPYQRALEEKSGVSLPNADYFGEVGYLHVDKGSRGYHLGAILVAGTLAAVKKQGLFATIHSKNIGSRRLFDRKGFVQVGKPWPSTEVRDEVNLYIRIG